MIFSIGIIVCFLVFANEFIFGVKNKCTADWLLFVAMLLLAISLVNWGFGYML